MPNSNIMMFLICSKCLKDYVAHRYWEKIPMKLIYWYDRSVKDIKHKNTNKNTSHLVNCALCQLNFDLHTCTTSYTDNNKYGCIPGN